MKLYIILDHLNCVMIQNKWCCFLVLQAALQLSDVIFSTSQTLSFTYLVIISTLLMVIAQKYNCVSTF